MSLPTAVAIRHVGFEDLGAFAEPLERAGYRIHYYDAGIDELWTLEPVKTELVMVLGGPVGAYEEAHYPFLREELDLLAQRLAAGRPTLGICLGAQLMARALGARVYPAREKEIGFAPVALTAEGRASCLAAFDGVPVLHWHGDTFDLPGGAVRLASTALCDNQAFSFGHNAIGFQFHPEAGGEGFERWLIGHAHELAAAGKDVAQLRADHRRLGPDLRRRAVACLESWLGQIAG
ncbi:GMP synthase [glutamine-hydrolyzing] [bacterium YEK0313]|nr:GMP synthase [glutamine-hydrolyzing] [bacterium YEK0313]